MLYIVLALIYFFFSFCQKKKKRAKPLYTVYSQCVADLHLALLVVPKGNVALMTVRGVPSQCLHQCVGLLA